VLAAPQTLRIGESANASVAGFDQSDRPFSLSSTTWTSSAPGVASVSNSGVVTALAPGIAMIGAASGAVSGSFPVTVIPPAVPAASVVVSPTSSELFVGESVQFAATLFSAAGAPQPGRAVAWSSSNPASATVTSAGLLRAVDAGTVIVSAVIDGIHGTVPVAVSGVADSTIQILVVSPTVEQTVTDTLRASATVASARPLRRVFATIGARQIPMGPMKVGPPGKQVDGWGADIDISGDPAGPSIVTFTAFDVEGHFWNASAAFEHQRPSGGSGVPPATGYKLVAPPSPIRVRPRG
jgi:hypothetical protein